MVLFIFIGGNTPHRRNQTKDEKKRRALKHMQLM
jgi:hypothetical protein